MNYSNEIFNIFSSNGAVDSIGLEEKRLIAKKIEEMFPVSMELMKCYNDMLPVVDSDKWIEFCGKTKDVFGGIGISGRVFLYVKSHPINLLFSVPLEIAGKILADVDFSYPFIIVSSNFDGFFMETSSGNIYGSGLFEELINKVKGADERHELPISSGH